MLWSEFIEGTGCKDTEKNYEVYKELEIIYTNTDCSKSHIYEMGKKLVDNSKSEKELEIERQVKAEIEEFVTLKETYRENLSRYEYYLKECENTDEEIRWLKSEVKYYKEQVRHCKNRIAALKCVLA